MPTPPDETPRKAGRPRAAVPSARITTWVRASDYDRLFTLAKQHDTSISALVRELLTGRLGPRP